MKTGRAALAVFLLWTATPAFAHRLDEFLQATTIAVEKDHVVLQLRLTPGVDVARAVLADVDTDGNGVISAGEQAAYAGRVLRDLSLTVDGNRLSLERVSSVFPTVEEVREGLGEILLRVEADVPPGGHDRRLVFENRYQSGIAVYLVNCLLPNDPDIHVTGQNRNFEQSSYQLDYTQTSVRSILQPAAISSVLKETNQVSGQSLFAAYFFHGVRRIHTGYDHLLFAGALVLAVGIFLVGLYYLCRALVGHS